MARKSIIAGAIIFILWAVIDFIMHGIILGNAYAATASLWRPMEDMSIGLIYLVSAVSVSAFTAIYAAYVQPKTMKAALGYGLIFGIGAGFSMGYGSYAVMPLPQMIAVTWFLGTAIKSVLAGALLGAVVK
jgi:hypothetical protein